MSFNALIASKEASIAVDSGFFSSQARETSTTIGAIIGYTELAKDDVPEDARVLDNLQEVLNAGKRAKDLVRQILSFSRQTEQRQMLLQISPNI